MLYHLVEVCITCVHEYEIQPEVTYRRSDPVLMSLFMMLHTFGCSIVWIHV